LLVDDDEGILKTAGAMLRRGGYSVITASGPLQALRAAREFHGEIHLLLTDIVMPGMDGVALAQKLAAERPNLHILLITGYTDVRGRLPLIRKPFSMNQLLEKVRNVIKGSPGLAIDAGAD
jgi:DNA-binding NtrC family response regulator